MVPPVYLGDPNVARGEPAGGGEARESAAHDHDVGRLGVRHAVHLRVYYRP
jgi:hypothetical protein